MNLQQYGSAQAVKADVGEKAIYAKVLNGNKRGSIGEIVDVKSPFYSKHLYRLKIAGKRQFWVEGSDLQILTGYEGETLYIKTDEARVFSDVLGRTLTVGCTVSFPRMVSGRGVEMIVGTVRRISDSGSLYVVPFIISEQTDIDTTEIRIGTPCKAMIIDRDTLDAVMMAKLVS